MYQFANILSYISFFSVLIPIICYFTSKKNSKVITILFALLLVSLASDLGNEIYVRSGFRGYYILNTYFLLQFALLSYIYRILLKNKIIIDISIIIYIIFSVLNTVFVQRFYEFQNWSRLIEGIIILNYSIKYYRQMLKTNIDLLRFYPFWLNCAVYLYFAFNLFLFIMSTYIFKNIPTDVGMVAWSFHNFNNIVKNILFAVAICYVGVKLEDYRETRF